MSPIGWPGCLYTHSFERSCVKLLSLNLPHKHTVKRARFWILILLLFVRVCVCMCEREGVSVCVRDFPAVCAVRRSQCSSSLYPTEFTARELCQRCDVLASKKAQDALFFFSPFCISSHSISLTLLTAACVVYMYTKKKIKCSQPHPSVFLLCIHGNKNSLFCLLGLYQRCPRRLAHNCV